MALDVDVVRFEDAPDRPGDDELTAWAQLAAGDISASLTIAIVDAQEAQRLNREYRGKDRPTNVLSFPAELPEAVRASLDAPPLGDLALCAPVVAAEARDQGKEPMHHWAHLVIHGVLHLLGYDHEDAAGAADMESLEIRRLGQLGIPDPYSDRP